MKIVHARIEGFNAFAVSAIASLDVSFDEKLQIILGTNGSGKSQLLKQLTPLPPTRGEYTDVGYRQLTIEHNGAHYTLTSDFSEKDGAHLFQVNGGKNLNEGRTTDVQYELIEHYLGVDRKINTLLQTGFDIPHMTAGARKALFVEFNPAQVGFIMDDHKRVCSYLRDIRSNLTRLHARKTELSSMMLDESVLTAMREEAEKLNSDTMANIGFISTLKTIISGLSNRTVDSENDLDEIARWRKEVRRVTPAYQALCQEKKNEELQRCLKDLGSNQGRKDHLESTIHNLITEIAEIQTSLSESTDDEQAQSLRLTIETLTKEIQELASFIKGASNLWSAIDLLNIGLHLDDLKSLLTEFLDCPVVIPQRRIFALRADRLRNHQFEIQELRSRASRVQAVIDKCNGAIQIKEGDVPDEPCAKFTCPLYRHWKTQVEQAKQERERCEYELNKITKRLRKLERFGELRRSQLNTVGPYMEKTQRLVQLIQKCPLFAPYFNDVNVPTQLRLNPLRFYHAIEHHRQLSEAEVRKGKLTKELEGIYKELAKRATLSEGEQARLEDRLDRLKSQLINARIAHREVGSRIDGLTTDIFYINHLNTQLELSKTLMSRVSSDITDMSQAHERRLLEELLQKLNAFQSEAITKQGEISIQIREQDTLKARYDEEVLGEIEKLEKEKVEWEHLEKALKDIPRLGMINYINTLIEIANAYIASVFTYDLIITPLPLDSRLDYRLPLTVSGIPIPDIALGSKAQKELINLAFHLAIRKVSNLENYPISLDEVGASFDNTHKHRLLDLLSYLIDGDKVSQMFLVNHHAAVHEGLSNGQTLILNTANVVAPQVYNEHVVFNMPRSIDA